MLAGAAAQRLRQRGVALRPSHRRDALDGDGDDGEHQQRAEPEREHAAPSAGERAGPGEPGKLGLAVDDRGGVEVCGGEGRGGRLGRRGGEPGLA
ncbi:MAG: hypothetical protein F4Z60_13260 [Chloroflexi bacterium]|nr:hypothetical protein [Chloroflexota bacterium]